MESVITTLAQKASKMFLNNSIRAYILEFLSLFIIILSTGIIGCNENEIVYDQDVQTALEKLHQFYGDVIGEEIKTIKVLSTNKSSEAVPFELIHAKVTGKQSSEVEISKIDGKVYRYSLDSLDKKKFGTNLSKISKEEAFNCIIPFLEYHNLSTDIETYHMSVSREKGDKIIHSKWDISGYDVRYKGIPCRKRGLRVFLSAISGEATLMSYRPIIVPAQHDVRISKSEAVTSCDEWLNQNLYYNQEEYRFPDDVEEMILEVIASPNNCGELFDSDERILFTDTTYYCWEVPFRYREAGRWFSSKLWVNNTTGEVIGVDF